MTEDTPATDTAAAPVIDQAAAARAKLDAQMKEQQATDQAEHAKMMAERNHRMKEEREIAAAQDLALKTIRANCDAGRAAFARSQAEAKSAAEIATNA